MVRQHRASRAALSAVVATGTALVLAMPWAAPGPSSSTAHAADRHGAGAPARGAAARAPLDYLAPPGRCRHAEDADASRAAQLAAIRCLTNYARGVRGVRPLARWEPLDRSSAGKARDEVRCGYSHEACGRAPVFWFRRAGVLCPSASCAENLDAWTVWGLDTPADVMSDWLRSRSHREGLLDPRMTRLGVAVACRTPDGDGLRECAWVSHFAGRLAVFAESATRPRR